MICGKTFAKDMQHPKRQKCPECHKLDPHNKNTQVLMTAASFIEMKRCENNEENKRRERMRLRDAAWARWERENGVQPTYRADGGKIIETRGHVCMGFLAASGVQHN